jgi:hypothetical protein
VSASSQAVSVTGTQVNGAGSLLISGVFPSNSNVNTAIVASVSGQVNNVADSITCNSFYFEPIY